MQRPPSPYRLPSPYTPVRGDIQYGSLPTGTAKVGPGAVTFTTSTGPDGQIIYQSYRAVAASYQTPDGVYEIYTGGNINRQDEGNYVGSYSNNHHQAFPHKDRREDKGVARRNHDARKNSDYELRLARERDAHSGAQGNRDRRKSVNSGGSLPSGFGMFPVVGGTAEYQLHPTSTTEYSSTPYSTYAPAGPSGYSTGLSSHNRLASGEYTDLNRLFDNIDLSKEQAEHNMTISAEYSRPRRYSTSDKTHDRISRTTSGNYSDRRNPYTSSPNIFANTGPYDYAPAHGSGRSESYSAFSYSFLSPNPRVSDMSSFGTANSTGYPGSSYASSSPAQNLADHIVRSTSPFSSQSTLLYPRNDNLESQFVVKDNNSWSRASSRTGSPHQAFSKSDASPRKSPNVVPKPLSGGPQQLPAPEAFFRPFNAANSFAPFGLIKIKDLEDINDQNYPQMPIVLSTHDIFPDEWKRCMQDLGRCWTGQLPVPGVAKDGQPPKRSTLAKDLVHLWNVSFFLRRGVELLLYKGRERRTGPQAGQIEFRLPYHDADDSPPPSRSSSESGLSDYENPEATRRHEEKLAQRRRRKEERARQWAKARGKIYTAYIACIPQPQVPPIAYATRPSGGFKQIINVPSYGAFAHSTPIAVPTTRSHGYGGRY